MSHDERHRSYPADSDFGVVASEPYQDRIVYFGALELLGYPVERQFVSAEELNASWGGAKDEYFGWALEHYSGFIRPVVTVPQFEDYVETMDAPGDIYTQENALFKDVIDDTTQQIFCNHAIGLLSLLEFGSLEALVTAYDKLCDHDEYRPRWFGSLDNGTDFLNVSEKDVVLMLLMATLPRFEWLKHTGNPFVSHKTVSRGVHQLLRQAERRRLRPIEAEGLAGIALNHCRAIEALVPAILDYKQSPRAVS